MSVRDREHRRVAVLTELSHQQLSRHWTVPLVTLRQHTTRHVLIHAANQAIRSNTNPIRVVPSDLSHEYSKASKLNLKVTEKCAFPTVDYTVIA